MLTSSSFVMPVVDQHLFSKKMFAFTSSKSSQQIKNCFFLFSCYRLIFSSLSESADPADWGRIKTNSTDIYETVYIMKDVIHIYARLAN